MMQRRNVVTAVLVGLLSFLNGGDAFAQYNPNQPPSTGPKFKVTSPANNAQVAAGVIILKGEGATPLGRVEGKMSGSRDVGGPFAATGIACTAKMDGTWKIDLGMYVAGTYSYEFTDILTNTTIKGSFIVTK